MHDRVLARSHNVPKEEEEEEEEEEDRGKTRACVCVSGGKEKKALASKGTPPSTDAHRRHHPQH